MSWGEVFEYDEGVLYWKDCARKGRNGKPAGFRYGPRGVILIRYQDTVYYGHRIVWEMHNGAIPPEMYVVHVNKIRHDNRLENLSMKHLKVVASGR